MATLIVQPDLCGPSIPPIPHRSTSFSPVISPEDSPIPVYSIQQCSVQEPVQDLASSRDGKCGIRCEFTFTLSRESRKKNTAADDISESLQLRVQIGVWQHRHESKTKIHEKWPPNQIFTFCELLTSCDFFLTSPDCTCEQYVLEPALWKKSKCSISSRATRMENMVDW